MFVVVYTLTHATGTWTYATLDFHGRLARPGRRSTSARAELSVRSALWTALIAPAS